MGTDPLNPKQERSIAMLDSFYNALLKYMIIKPLTYIKPKFMIWVVESKLYAKFYDGLYDTLPEPVRENTVRWW